MKQQLTHSLNTKQQRALQIAVVGAIILGAYFLRSFFSLIVVAAIVSYLFSPVYNQLRAKTKSEGAAASLTLLITLAIVIIPLSLIVAVTIVQLNGLVRQATDWLASPDFRIQSRQLIDGINSLLSNIPNNSYTLTTDKILEYANSNLSVGVSNVLNVLRSSAGSAAQLATLLVIYIYVFSAMTTEGKHITNTIQKLNPLGEEITKLYLEKAGAMTKAMVRGQFIIAVCQGLTGALILQLCGIELFAFMALILTALSIVPLGGGIVIIPIAILQIALGNYWQGIVILLSHFLIVTNIDNVLRPRLVPKEARLNSALSILSVFGGVAAFGFLGIVIGPVFMILVVTTIQVYLETTSTTHKTTAAKRRSIART